MKLILLIVCIICVQQIYGVIKHYNNSYTGTISWDEDITLGLFRASIFTRIKISTACQLMFGTSANITISIPYKANKENFYKCEYNKKSCMYPKIIDFKSIDLYEGLLYGQFFKAKSGGQPGGFYTGISASFACTLNGLFVHEDIIIVDYDFGDFKTFNITLSPITSQNNKMIYFINISIFNVYE